MIIMGLSAFQLSRVKLHIRADFITDNKTISFLICNNFFVKCQIEVFQEQTNKHFKDTKDL